jgi:hypothetical protein
MSTVMTMMDDGLRDQKEEGRHNEQRWEALLYIVKTGTGTKEAERRDSNSTA